MEFLSITFYAFSGLSNFITSLILILIVIINNPRALANRIFAVFMFTVGFWSLFYFLWLNTSNIELADFYLRTCMIGVIFMPSTFVHFVNALLRQNTASFLNQGLNNKYLFIGNYLISIILAATVYTPLFAKEGGHYMAFLYWAVPGPVFPLHLAQFFFNFLFAFYLMSYSIKQSKGIFKNQVLYLFIGITIGVIAGITNYFFWYRIPIPPFLNIFVSLGVSFITYGIIKFRLMEVNIVFKKGTVYAGGLILVLIPTYLVLLWTQNIFFKTINMSYSLILLSLLIATALLFYTVKAKTESIIENTLFYKKYNPYKVLSNFTKEMVSVITLNELLDKIINTFTETLKIKKASIFLFDEEKKGYVMKASYGLDEEKNKIKIKQDVPLIDYFIEKEDVAIREEIERYPSTQQTQEMIKILKDIESEIAIPFMEKDKIVGFCNLSAKGDRGMYSHEDIELFLSLGHQAAIAIKNAQLIEKIKESKHVIRRMERLKTIGDMAAGLAHEIRNPLVPIKTCLEILPGNYGIDIESTKKIAVCALKEVERIESLLKEIMDYSRPRMPVFKDEDINDIMEKTVIFIEYEARKKGIRIQRKYDSAIPLIKVDGEQMKQVLLNLIINAIDAVGDNGEISIATQKARHMLSPSGKIGEREYVQIEITDNGAGIPEENIERIFNPFYTTKHASKEREGTGLGLSIVQEIITEHHGFVQVRSELGKGSSFLVNLPVEQPELNLREDRGRLVTNKKTKDITPSIKYPEEPFQIIQ
ncbi:MAG: ATP-binding protein [Nitrospirota bacterium]